MSELDKSSRYWSPSRTYELELKIGKIDLTPDLMSLSILTSIETPYQTFVLELFIDPNDIILEKIYGQTPLKLTTKMFYDQSPSLSMETIEIELMYLSSDMPLSGSVSNPQTIQKDRQNISFTCVARNAYTTMNSIVNSVYQGKRLSDVITDMASQVGATLEMDTNGQNTEVLDQVLIPSSTLYKTLKYLNRTFGLYDGMPVIYCTHDNKVKIKNLTSKMITSSKFIIHQLPLGSDNTEIYEKCNDGKNFYTKQNLHTTYKGNSVFAYLAPKMRHIVKPKDRLFHTIDVDLETFAQKYGLISKGNKIFFDSKAISSKSRVSMHKDHTGYELNESFINSKYARRVSAITSMSLSVERSIKILNLMDIGEAVELNTHIDLTNDFTGKYILRGSTIHFTRVKDWESSAQLLLMRTNRTIT